MRYELEAPKLDVSSQLNTQLQTSADQQWYDFPRIRPPETKTPLRITADLSPYSAQ